MAAPPPGTMPMPPAPARRKTPIGVLILGILTILLGIGTLGLGALLIIGGSMLAVGGGPIGGAFGALIGIFGGILAIFGIIAIVAGVGLIKLRGWAWWLTMIVGILSLLSSLATGQWYLAAVWLIIVVYLVVVKKEFGARPAGM